MKFQKGDLVETHGKDLRSIMGGVKLVGGKRCIVISSQNEAFPQEYRSWSQESHSVFYSIDNGIKFSLPNHHFNLLYSSG